MENQEHALRAGSEVVAENYDSVNNPIADSERKDKKRQEAAGKSIEAFVGRAVEALAETLDFEKPEQSKKISIWKAASAIGRARVLFLSESGAEIAEQDPKLFESYERTIAAVKYKVNELPEDEPAAIISKWRLEKPLEPVLPELASDELVQANKPSGKFVPKPEEFISILQEKSEIHARTYQAVVELAQKIDAYAKENKIEGARVLLVGGSVRDIRSGVLPKDFDIEIYGLESEKIVEIARTVSNFHRVDECGAAFQVRKMWLNLGQDEAGQDIHVDIDLAVPRVDSQSGGHRDVKTRADPNMPIREACRRRDFTINSMAADILTGELFDFFGGDDDLKNGVLKVTDEKLFCDDALRVLRGMQFAGRQALNIEERTAEIMRLMVFELDTVDTERFREEWTKLLLKSPMPSFGLIRGKDIGLFDEMYPEFGNLRETRQSPEWHPEGNAWIHTFLVVDEAVKIIRREGLEGDAALAIMLASLCHDLGKSEKTVKGEDGKITSKGHEIAGVPIARLFLDKIGVAGKISRKVLKLVENHMAPARLYAADIASGGAVSDGAIRRLAVNLGDDVTIEELVMVAEADNAGRGASGENEMIEKYLHMDGFAAGQWLLERARAINVENQKPKPLLDGEFVLGFGFKKGPEIGKLIRLGDRLRDEKGFSRQKVIVEIYRSAVQKGTDDAQKTIEYLEDLLK